MNGREGNVLRKLITAITIAAGLLSSPYIALAAKVVVDPGHGGHDPGAVGINGLYEKTVNNEISYRLRDLLEANGYEVVMTRDTDKSLTLQDRVAVARAADADLFVSVHANAHPSSSVRGTMVLYHDAARPIPSYPASEEMVALTPQSKQLAQLVLNEILKQVPNTNRGIVPSSAYVVRMGNVPSVLVETAFLSNRQDAQMLASPAVRERYAQGILNGILAFLPPVFRDVGSHWARESIVRLHEQGIANGNDGRFHPDQPLTRAELMAFAQRAFGLGGSGTKPGGVVLAEYGGAAVTDDVYSPDDAAVAPDEPASYPDLQKAHWSYALMLEAVEAGVLRGYPDGTIRPDAPVSRAEVAVVLDRLIGHTLIDSASDGEPSFEDVDARYWAYAPIARLGAAGLVRGVEHGRYGPDRYVTRAEIAAMVDRQLARAAVVAASEEAGTDESVR